MGSTLVRERLAILSTGARYGVFVGLGALLALAGVIMFVVAANGPNADRAWHLFHVNWLVFTGLSGGSMAFVAVQKVTKAKWSGLMIRFSEACLFFLPISLLGFVLIFTVGYDHIYGPMNQQLHTLSPGKALWLSHSWMATRLGVGLLLLYGLAFRLIKADLVPDVFEVKGGVSGARRRLYDRWSAGFDSTDSGRAQHDRLIYALAPAFVVTYAMVFTLVAFDGIMALQPHWFSNLLGGFYFMGSFLGAHMLLALLMLYGRRQVGLGELISPKQRHDLGKLCFGFTVFWAYLMWAQFLVIWYGNLPEETGFVFARLWGEWRPVGTAVFLGMFIIPFAGLLGVLPKKTPGTLGLFATVSLCSLWLERYLLVVPSITREPGPVFGAPEIGATIMFAGLFLLAYGCFARVFPMVSPRLAEITLDRERGHAHAEVAGEFEHEESSADYTPAEALERRHRSR